MVWALVLGVTAYVASRSGKPTAPEQTSVAQARVGVDEALARVAGAAGAETVAALSAYQLNSGCRITTVRKGTDLSRMIQFYTAPGGERALLDRLAAALPESFRARVPRPIGSGTPALRASTADFVTLHSQVVGPGEVRVEAEAGCRTGTDLGTPAFAADPAPAERATIDPVLRALGVTSPRWHAYQASCLEGGAIRTVEAESNATPTPSGPLSAALQAVSGDDVLVLNQPRRYAFRDGSAEVAVRLDARAVTVTATIAGAC